MTLNGVMAVILRYFSEFGYLPGVLRKSSRSLSHLLMSSCFNYDFKFFNDASEFSVTSLYVVFIFSSKVHVNLSSISFL